MKIYWQPGSKIFVNGLWVRLRGREKCGLDVKVFLSMLGQASSFGRLWVAWEDLYPWIQFKDIVYEKI